MVLACSSEGASSSSGSPDGGASSSSGATSSGGTSGGGMCTKSPISPTGVCTLSKAKPATALRVEAVIPPGCDSECTVSVEGMNLRLVPSRTTCTGGVARAPCAGSSSASCAIPALAPGTYQIVSDTGRSVPLVVTANGTETACKIEDPRPAPTPDSSCATADDCVGVFSATCRRDCSCADLAISKSAQAAYTEAQQALASSCGVSFSSPPPCAACPAPKLECSADKKCVLAKP
jgi:hypothetical protein